MSVSQLISGRQKFYPCNKPTCGDFKEIYEIALKKYCEFLGKSREHTQVIFKFLYFINLLSFNIVLALHSLLNTVKPV